MSCRWRDHEAAREELREAASFLEDEREGWGDRFIDAVEAALEKHRWLPAERSFIETERRCLAKSIHLARGLVDLVRS